MITRQQQDNPGTGTAGWWRNEGVNVGDMGDDAAQAISVPVDQNEDTYFSWQEDFLGYGQTAPWNTDYSPAGSPSYGFVSNGIGGQIEAETANTDEPEIIASAWDDNLQINALRYFVAETRWLLPDDLAANEFTLVGVSAAIKTGVDPATLDGFLGAVISVDEDNEIHVIVQNGDDVEIDEATGIIVEDDTFYWTKVEYDQYGNVNVYHGPGLGEDGDMIYSTPVTWAAGQKFQPISGIAKASGTTTPAIRTDCMKGYAQRGLT